ncbi:HNH endonuclease [Sorangium sp. So ce394]|uniref:HNH endonuclease n=1 Tax=Sorangium sp. So ce394 TaxID=3133310 RepID=UPI003F5CA458
MIRARLFKGLRAGTMKVGSLFADVRDMPSDRCVYCGTTPPPKLHGDHLIPRHRGGPESAPAGCAGARRAAMACSWTAA